MQRDLSIIMTGLSSIAQGEEVVGSHHAGDFFAFRIRLVMSVWLKTDPQAVGHSVCLTEVAKAHSLLQ